VNLRNLFRAALSRQRPKPPRRPDMGHAASDIVGNAGRTGRPNDGSTASPCCLDWDRVTHRSAKSAPPWWRRTAAPRAPSRRAPVAAPVLRPRVRSAVVRVAQIARLKRIDQLVAARATCPAGGYELGRSFPQNPVDVSVLSRLSGHLSHVTRGLLACGEGKVTAEVSRAGLL
jgi:hypothetical protein